MVSAAPALQAAQVQRQRCAGSVTPSGRGRAAAAPLDAVDLRKDHVVLLSSETSLGHQVSATAPWYVARPRLGGYSKGWRRCERRPVSPARCQNSAALGSRQLSPCLLVSTYSGQRGLKPCASVLFFRNNVEVYCPLRYRGSTPRLRLPSPSSQPGSVQPAQLVTEANTSKALSKLWGGNGHYPTRSLREAAGPRGARAAPQKPCRPKPRVEASLGQKKAPSLLRRHRASGERERLLQKEARPQGTGALRTSTSLTSATFHGSAEAEQSVKPQTQRCDYGSPLLRGAGGGQKRCPFPLLSPSLAYETVTEVAPQNSHKIRKDKVLFSI